MAERTPSAYFLQRLAEIKANPGLVAKPPRATIKAAKNEPPKVALGQKGWVYFITGGDEDIVKIGFTTNRDSRLSGLQTGAHKELRYEYTFPAHEAAERILHRHFAKHRIRGEWYKLTWQIEELWDDLTDYQGMRSASSFEGSSGKEFLADMDSKTVDLDDLRVILSTIGKQWPEEFRPKIVDESA